MNLEEDIQNGLKIVSSGTRLKDYETKNWKSVPSDGIVNVHNFPSKSPRNLWDCGVIVCMYKWSLVTGCYFDQNVDDLEQFFGKARVKITKRILYSTSQ